MFLSTPKGGWANGVASMFIGHQKKTVELVLAMIHGSCNVTAMCKGMGFESINHEELEDLLRLSHKLDAPKLTNVRFSVKTNMIWSDFLTVFTAFVGLRKVHYVAQVNDYRRLLQHASHHVLGVYS